MALSGISFPDSVKKVRFFNWDKFWRSCSRSCICTSISFSSVWYFGSGKPRNAYCTVPDISVGEIPYFYDDKITNDKKTNKTKREVLLEGCKVELEIYEFILKRLNSTGLNRKSVFYIKLVGVVEALKGGVFSEIKNLSEAIAQLF